MDYAMLSRYSIQSTSDQEDYIRYATIAANSPMALTPEQAAIWSYPLTEGDKEEVIFNMVNANFTSNSSEWSSGKPESRKI